MRRACLASWSLGLILAGLLSCADGTDDGGPGEPSRLHSPISDWPGRVPTSPTGGTGQQPPGTEVPDPSDMPPATGGTDPDQTPTTPGAGGGAVGGGGPGASFDAATPEPVLDAGVAPADDAAAPDDSDAGADAGDAGVEQG